MFNTNNPLGSTDPRDLSDNSEVFDRFANGTDPSYPDRFGNTRKSFSGMEQEFAQFLIDSGYVGTGVDGAYQDYDLDGPLTITAYNQIFIKDGEFYRAKADLSLPYVTTGTWVGDDETRFVSVGDAVLRQDLSSATVGDGSDLVAHTGTTDTVTQALDKRTIYVGSVAELEALSLPVGYNIYLTADGRAGEFVVKTGTPPSDPQQGIYIVLANGNYAQRAYDGISGDAGVNSAWFGLSESGTAADNATSFSAAITHLIAKGGGVCYQPAGDFAMDATTGITINTTAIAIKGAGREATNFLLEGDGDFLTFSNTGRSFGVADMSFKYAAPPASGAVITAETGATSGSIERIFINNPYDGIKLGNCQATRVCHIEIWGFTSNGVNLTGNLNDPYFHDWFLNGSNNPLAVGWRIAGKAHAMLASDIEIIQCNQPAQWIGAAATVNTVAFSRLFNCFFDSSTSPAYYQYLYDVEFHGCWWSQRETGAVFFDSKTVKFFGGSATNCDRHGMIWDSGCEDFEAHGFSWDSNSQESIGAYRGLVIAAGVTNFRIFGGYSGNAGISFPSAQQNGIILEGSNDNYVINGLKFDGNLGSPIVGHTASRDRRVVLCQGYVTRNAGVVSLTTDANGLLSIPHGLDVTPTVSFLSLTGDSTQEATVLNVDATDIIVRVRDTTTNADLNSGTVGIMWQASAET